MKITTGFCVRRITFYEHVEDFSSCKTETIKSFYS